MPVENIQYLLATYGLEKIFLITMNNGRRIMIDDLNRSKITFDHTKQWMIVEETIDKQTFMVINPYAYFEAIYIKKD
jgi:hypothetical protein